MTALYFKRAIEDIFKNKFLNIVTIITISLSILIVSAFILFFINANEIMNRWKKSMRIMVYLKTQTPAADVTTLKQTLESIDGVLAARFISKEDALIQLKTQLKRQSSLLENLAQNPLPDAFEIQLDATKQTWEKIEYLAAQMDALDPVEEVEYGQRWLGRFNSFFSLFRLAGYAMGGLFFMATVFIVANTIRLVIYSRLEEVEIMRLVGANDRFIKIPIYIEGLIQGALGAIIGLLVLFSSYLFISLNMARGFFSGLFQVQFLSPVILVAVILGSMVMGWLGCYLSLKQFLRI